MRLGIIGLPQSGKSTVFEALTRTPRDPGGRTSAKIGTVRVPDERVEKLSEMYQPKKTIFAQVEYFLPGIGERKDELARRSLGEGGSIWNSVRACDALIHVVRNFGYEEEEENRRSGDSPRTAGTVPEETEEEETVGTVPDGGTVPLRDFLKLDHEMIFADLMTLTKRLDRLNADKDRGKKYDAAEVTLIEQALKHLDGDRPLRRVPEIAASPLLKGFTLVSAKPMLVLFNNDDASDGAPEVSGVLADEMRMVMRGRLEAELAQIPHEDAEEFLAEFGIAHSALDRVVRASYDLLGLISFFTVGEDEVRAWTVRKDAPALDAADCIHSDIRRGFIRAEVLAYADLMSCGSYAEARKLAKVRLEGKTYPVKDGDIIEFRFNA